MTQMKHLSVVDGAFLHMESAEMPMHVGSLNLFEPPAGYTGEGYYEAVKAHVAKRMHMAAVFTRKLALMPFDLANPVWIHDDDIDLDYHVRYMVLPKPGTFEQLEALAARLHSMLLDRSRPLWEFYIIEGLADGRIGFYGKVHHSAVDGQAGVAMATSLFDITPEPRAVKPPREVRANTYQLGVAELLAAALQNQARQVVEGLKLVPALAKTVAGAVQKAIAERREESPEDRAARKAEKAPSAFKFAPPTPFNHSITNQRAFAAVSLPLPEIKAIGKGLGASINDMVLWLCSTALRSYLKDSRELPEKSLVAGVPISLRQEGDTTSNNQVAGTLIDLGTDEADPAERLKAIKRGTAAMKKQMGTFGGVIPTDFPSLGSPWLISGLASLYGRSRIADWLRLANVTISNVPGSKVPVYLVGAKMTDYYPLSIVVHGVALNITVQSHVDKICFGLIACRRAVPDVHELGQQVERAMALLRKLVAAPALAAPGGGRGHGRRFGRGTVGRRRPGRGREPRTASPRCGAQAPAPRRARRTGGDAAAPAAKRKRRNGAAQRTGPMRLVADVLVALVALLHLWFLVLEMFLWDKPLGLKTFRQTPEAAATSKVLAANQGLYNGFLAAGLLWGLLAARRRLRHQGVLPRLRRRRRRVRRRHRGAEDPVRAGAAGGARAGAAVRLGLGPVRRPGREPQSRSSATSGSSSICCICSVQVMSGSSVVKRILPSGPSTTTRSSRRRRRGAGGRRRHCCDRRSG